MKKRIALLVVVCLVLMTICLLIGNAQSPQPHAHQYWCGGKDDMTLSVHLMPDFSSLWPFDSPMFFWQRHDHPNGINLTQLDGGEYREGSWSVKDDILTLKFDDGEVMTGTFATEGLLLDYEGGFLLEYCYETDISEWR